MKQIKEKKNDVLPLKYLNMNTLNCRVFIQKKKNPLERPKNLFRGDGFICFFCSFYLNKAKLISKKKNGGSSKPTMTANYH